MLGKKVQFLLSILFLLVTYPCQAQHGTPVLAFQGYLYTDTSLGPALSCIGQADINMTNGNPITGMMDLGYATENHASSLWNVPLISINLNLSGFVLAGLQNIDDLHQWRLYESSVATNPDGGIWVSGSQYIQFTHTLMEVWLECGGEIRGTAYAKFRSIGIEGSRLANDIVGLTGDDILQIEITVTNMVVEDDLTIVSYVAGVFDTEHDIKFETFEPSVALPTHPFPLSELSIRVNDFAPGGEYGLKTCGFVKHLVAPSTVQGLPDGVDEILFDYYVNLFTALSYCKADVTFSFSMDDVPTGKRLYVLYRPRNAEGEGKWRIYDDVTRPGIAGGPLTELTANNVTDFWRDWAIGIGPEAERTADLTDDGNVDSNDLFGFSANWQSSTAKRTTWGPATPVPTGPDDPRAGYSPSLKGTDDEGSTEGLFTFAGKLYAVTSDSIALDCIGQAYRSLVNINPTNGGTEIGICNLNTSQTLHGVDPTSLWIVLQEMQLVAIHNLSNGHQWRVYEGNSGSFEGDFAVIGNPKAVPSRSPTKNAKTGQILFRFDHVVLQLWEECPNQSRGYARIDVNPISPYGFSLLEEMNGPSSTNQVILQIQSPGELDQGEWGEYPYNAIMGGTGGRPGITQTEEVESTLRPVRFSDVDVDVEFEAFSPGGEAGSNHVIVFKIQDEPTTVGDLPPGVNRIEPASYWYLGTDLSYYRVNLVFDIGRDYRVGEESVYLLTRPRTDEPYEPWRIYPATDLPGTAGLSLSRIRARDVTDFRAEWAIGFGGGTPPQNADLDSNSRIDANDLMAILERWHSP